MRKYRYRVVQAADAVAGAERTWEVLDTAQRCATCTADSGCPGVCVATQTARKAARLAATELEAVARTRQQPWADSAQAARAEAVRSQRLRTRHLYCVYCLRSVGEDPIPGLPWPGLCAMCLYLEATGCVTGDEERDVCGVRVHPLDVPGDGGAP